MISLMARVEGAIRVGTRWPGDLIPCYGYACVVPGFERWEFWITPEYEGRGFTGRWRMTAWEVGLAVGGSDLARVTPEEAYEAASEFLNSRGVAKVAEVFDRARRDASSVVPARYQ